MPEYLAPAVYVEEVSFRAPSIEGVGTTTTGFAGPTLTGPVGTKPELLTSFGDFQNIYGGYDDLSIADQGDPKNTNFLALSVKGFFDNGGSMLYVSRVFAEGKDKGIAGDGTVSDTTVAVTARFPGAFATNQTVTVTLNAAKTQATSNLPAGSLVALASNGSASIGTLAADLKTTDTQVAVTPALSGANPANIQIDSEVMQVTAVDSTKTLLTVTRAAAPAAHTAGAPVFSSIGALGANVALTDAQVTLGAALTGNPPAVIQIGTETLAVTAVDSTNTKLTVTRGANGTTAATHNSGDLVFVPIALFTNGHGTTFQNGSTSLSSTLPAGATVYVLTLRVAAFGAASQKILAPGGSAQVQQLVYDGLGFDPAHPNYLGSALGVDPPRHIDALQNQIAFVIGKSVTPTGLFSALFGSWGGPGSTASKTYTLTGGDDGGEPESGDYDAALQQFEGLEDIAIVATPGSSIFAQSQAIINSLITHVSRERAYRVAILDTPPDQIASDNEDVRSRIDSSYAALYVPWIVVPNPLARSGTAIPAEVTVPPSGYMAGIYARNDEQHSVAKAPANEVVLGALDFERNITFAEQATLNPLGINCLRFFPDRGYRVWGARTASSDTEFMYVNVRRYLIYLEHSIDNSTQWAVFENNGPALWPRVKDSVDSFLNNEFAEGRLLGTTPEEAYFVRCDRTTMTQNDLDMGRMICLIGVALLKPAEFVIFRIGQKTADARS